MNAARTTTILLLSLVALPAGAASPSTVDSVVVFADRAEVTRTAAASCTGGAGEALFDGLSTSLDARTLRAEATGGAKALAVRSEVVELDEDRDARAAALQKEIDEVGAALHVTHDRLETLGERTRALRAYAAYLVEAMNEDARSNRPDPARWSAALALLDRERDAGVEEERAIAAARRPLYERNALLHERLAALGGRKERQALRVRVAVQCRGAAAPLVRLSYVVPGATWRPEYDLRFTPKAGKVGPGTVGLTVSAVIRQATGEDWEDARIVLSTARPRLGSEAPRPAPLWIDGEKVEEKKVLVQAAERRAVMRGPAGPAGTGAAEAAVDERGQSFVLKLPHRATVRADGRPYWVPVDVVTTQGEAALVTTPKLAPFVYQVVRFDNPAAYPLLEGTMHVHRRGTLMGDVKVEHRAPGEPLEVSLGVDEELKVERIDLLARDRRPGFLSGTKHVDRAYRTEVTSRAKQPLVVEVRENVPVSKVDDVKVEIRPEKTTAGYDLDGHRGFLTWKLALKPGENKDVDLGFVVHLPASWEVR